MRLVTIVLLRLPSCFPSILPHAVAFTLYVIFTVISSTSIVLILLVLITPSIKDDMSVLSEHESLTKKSIIDGALAQPVPRLTLLPSQCLLDSQEMYEAAIVGVCISYIQSSSNPLLRSSKLAQ